LPLTVSVTVSPALVSPPTVPVTVIATGFRRIDHVVGRCRVSVIVGVEVTSTVALRVTLPLPQVVMPLPPTRVNAGVDREAASREALPRDTLIENALARYRAGA
jgi:hypothetical protein